MSIHPDFDPIGARYNTQDAAHTPQEILGSTAVTHSLSPELRTEIDAIKEAALAELAKTGTVPSAHMPEVTPLSPEARVQIDAVKAEALRATNNQTI
ncbi:MAG TPA: hypothetical protein VGE30_01780 [Candidatus Saccharimonadales bacterium]